MYYFVIWEILKTDGLKMKWLTAGAFNAKAEEDATARLRELWQQRPEVCKEIRCVKDGHIFLHHNNVKECFKVEKSVYKKGYKWTA